MLLYVLLFFIFCLSCVSLTAAVYKRWVLK